MSCLEPHLTQSFVGAMRGAKMVENTGTSVSRRSARTFVEEHDTVDIANNTTTGQAANESKYGSGDERDRAKSQPQSLGHGRIASTNLSNPSKDVPTVDLGKDIGGMFPTTMEDMGKHVRKSLKAANTLPKVKEDGRPLNFGTIIPGSIYRSSFPMVEDFQFLGTLGLKTVLTLVRKEHTPEYRAFVKTHGIQHCVIEMQGTKKVDIPDSVMHSILQVALDKQNHPLLIHCNHGKHRTGCTAAVIRHIAGWNVDDIIEEYKGFAAPKIRECDVKYITDYEVASLEGLFLRNPTPTQVAVLTRARMTRFLVISAVALAIWFVTAMFWEP